MSIYIIILLAVVFLLIMSAALVIFNSIRTKGGLARALNMTLLLVVLPRQNPDQSGGQAKPVREQIAVMEQLFAAFSSIHSKGWNKFVYGEPYISLEMAVHHVGQDIHFYLAVPRNMETVFERQIHGIFPDADVSRVKDYNIFNPTGATAGAHMVLSGDHILPFKTYSKMDSDPLASLITSLAKLDRQGEGASIQLLIRPSHDEGLRNLAQKVAREMQAGNQYKKALELAKKGTPKPKDNEPQSAKPLLVVTPMEDEIIKSLVSKASRPLFEVNIRILASAVDQFRADQIVNEVAGSFVHYSSPDLNSFKVIKASGRSLEKLIFNFAFRLFDKGQAIPLTSEEITSVYHFPMVSAGMARIRFLQSKTAEPPSDIPQEGIVLGDNVFRGRNTPIRILDEDRRRHMYIIGQTGTGKTTQMKGMVLQDIIAGKGICVIDPHGDFAEYAASVVPSTRVDDVIYFNPQDVQRPMGLNLLEFDPSRPEQKTFITNDFYQIMKTIYKDLPEAFGPMFEQYYKNSVLLLLDVYQKKFELNGNSSKGIEDQIPTLAEIPRVLADADFRHELLMQEENPMVRNFWEKEAEKAGGEAALENIVPYITSKLNPFLANDYIRPIIAQPVSAFNFRDIMDSGKILVVNLSKGRIGDLNANLLGLIIVSKLTMAALSRDTSDPELKDLYLYMDEFQNFTTPSISTILSEARKYRLCLIMANQFIKQLPDQIKDAIFGNVGSMCVYRISAEDAETDVVKNNYSPVFTPQDMGNVANMNCFVRMLVRGSPTRPFNMLLRSDETFSAQSKGNLETITEISRLKYGRIRQDVESEISARYTG